MRCLRRGDGWGVGKQCMPSKRHSCRHSKCACSKCDMRQRGARVHCRLPLLWLRADDASRSTTATAGSSCCVAWIFSIGDLRLRARQTLCHFIRKAARREAGGSGPLAGRFCSPDPKLQPVKSSLPAHPRVCKSGKLASEQRCRALACSGQLRGCALLDG